jgi:hypothetical protein
MLAVLVEQCAIQRESTAFVFKWKTPKNVLFFSSFFI